MWSVASGVSHRLFPDEPEVEWHIMGSVLRSFFGSERFIMCRINHYSTIN